MITRKIFTLAIVSIALLSGCATSQRTVPYVDLGKDYFESGLPKVDRLFVEKAEAPIKSINQTVYLRVSTPPGIREESRKQHIATVQNALQRSGVRRIINADELQSILEKNGVKFTFNREPDPTEWKRAEVTTGPFTALHVEYGFGYGGRRYIRIQAQNSTDGRLLFDGSYDSTIWSDVNRELIYPAMNLYANWVNGQLRLRPVR